jgi:hypothetical protein
MYPASAVAPKSGALCKKLGATSGQGTKRLVCGSVTQLRWLPSPVKPPSGSIFNPLPMGQTLSTSSFGIALQSVDFNIGAEICASNPLNEGCRITAKLSGEVDVNSPIRWVGINLKVLNKSKTSLYPGGSSFTYYLVLANNDFLENLTTPVFENSIANIVIAQGSTQQARIAFALPKEAVDLNPLLVIRNESQGKVSDYYLLLDW